MKLTTQLNSTSSKNTADTKAQSLYWKFGADFHGNEAVRNDATDFVVFTVMGVLCAWPMIGVAVTVFRVFYGYY